MEGSQKYVKPLPTPDPETIEFWTAAKKHELRIQKCKKCSTYCFPPRPLCPRCHTFSLEWVKISGKGKIYSFIVVYQPTDPVFEKDIPYAVVLVDIQETKGIRMAGNFLGQLDDIKIGMPVLAVFADVTDEISLVNWKPAA